jgi:hypothetical protein
LGWETSFRVQVVEVGRLSNKSTWQTSLVQIIGPTDIQMEDVSQIKEVNLLEDMN